MKYIVVTGGVISGVGKGIIASSTGVLMKAAGMRVTAIKIDPYLNIDAGTLSPFDHGETFVLDDGGETDLDLGNYERFLNVTLTRDHNITTGKIYQRVIEKERRGDYLGKTVQVVPHVTDAIQDWIENVAQCEVVDEAGHLGRPDVCVIELGGTVGDIESAPFVEALRQFQFRVGKDNFSLIHVSLVPAVGSTVPEQKSKPTQHSVINLRGLGLSPDVIACRSTEPLHQGVKDKIALFCHVAPHQVVSVHDASSVYQVPLILHEQGLVSCLAGRLDLSSLSLRPNPGFFAQWAEIAAIQAGCKESVSIALVGKYTHLPDSYLSISKALNHAALHLRRRVQIDWIEASDLEKDDGPDGKYAAAWNALQTAHGILVPGGFGDRGFDGKLAACKFARLQNRPFLGICLGFQAAVIEFARNVLELGTANSTEMDGETSDPVVIFMPEGSKAYMGGTMRLGSRRSLFLQQCQASRLYESLGAGKTNVGGNEVALAIDERHRHRYEVNPDYVPSLEAAGLNFVARDESGKRMEVLELPNHRYFVGCQFHPEFKSRPLHPSPLFVGLLQAAIANQQ